MNNLSLLIKNKVLHFARISKHKKLAIYILITILFSLFISWQYYSFNAFYQKQVIFDKNLHVKLHHQQQIIQTLKDKAQARLMTPKVAKQLLPINQSIQQLLLPSLSILSTQWEMASRPLLTLQIEGDFLALRYFIFQILQQNNHLQLVKCKIAKGSLNFDEIEVRSKENIDWQDIRSKEEIKKQQGKIQSELLFQLNLLVNNKEKT